MITVITGGSGSGKSAYAEEQVLSYGDGKRIYIATMEPFGEEGAKRIARHHKLREGKGFTTVERYIDLDGLMIPRGSEVLLECMSNLVANEMFRPDGAGDHLLEAVVSGVRHLEALADHLCIVTNEISSEAWDYEEQTVLYEKYLGQVNQELGRMADEVVEVTCGIPEFIKGGKPLS
ncbi:MAG: bifunctional adenosylcobinamide kinase/adenosylcobinamide-phosphate guanylyltransferase [Blautia sp.]|jgi:adenosylcobinamide kinase/adenosylcobinamide-phosphate guanylyltransferase